METIVLEALARMVEWAREEKRVKVGQRVVMCVGFSGRSPPGNGFVYLLSDQKYLPVNSGLRTRCI